MFQCSEGKAAGLQHCVSSSLAYALHSKVAVMTVAVAYRFPSQNCIPIGKVKI